MAKWTDGPEYAPLARPDVFVAPDTAPLPVAEPAPPSSRTLTEARPAPDYTADDDRVALASLEPPAPATRDPHEPFDVVSTPVTSWAPPTGTPAPPGAAAPSPQASPPPTGPDGLPRVDAPAPPANTSAWGSAHIPHAAPPPHAPWAPEQPFPAAAPRPTQHLPGPSSSPQPPHPAPWDPPEPPRPLKPVTLGDMARAVTPGVLICLVVGGLVTGLALPLYLIAMVLASRIEYRRAVITRAFGVGAAGAFAGGLLTMIVSYGFVDLLRWYEASLGWASLACWVMVGVTMLTVGDALRRGERPDPR